MGSGVGTLTKELFSLKKIICVKIHFVTHCFEELPALKNKCSLEAVIFI